MAFISSKKRGGTSLETPLKHLTLGKRRQFVQIRRYATALLIAFSVFFALQAIVDSQQTQTVVVAKHSLKRGVVLRAKDVGEQQVPHDSAFDTALRDARQSTGLVLQTDITAGSVLLEPMARKTPVLAKGLTVAEIRISHSSSAVMIGDTVSLVSPIGCPAATDAHGQAPHNMLDSDGSDTPQADAASAEPIADAPQTDADGLCTLTKSALVMSGAHQNSSDETTMMEFALTPHEAAATAQIQEQTAIMVVTSKDGKQ